MKHYCVVLQMGSEWIAVSRVYETAVNGKLTLCTEYDVRETLTKAQAIKRCAAFREQYPAEQFDVYLNGEPLEGQREAIPGRNSG